MTATVSVLESALSLAARGWHVFPVEGKIPVGHWPSQATPDLATVTAMFAGVPRNIGIACGPSGLLVIDEDTPGGFERFATEHDHQIPPTYTVATGKGKHFYFRAPAGEVFGNGAGALAPYGIDVRGAGGYVVGPGSKHATGAIYSPNCFTEAAEAPEWLCEALRPVSTPTAPTINAEGYEEITERHAANKIRKAVQELCAVVGFGSVFKDKVFGLAYEISRLEIAENGSADAVEERMEEVFAELPNHPGLAMDDNDRKWVADGIVEGCKKPWRIVEETFFGYPITELEAQEAERQASANGTGTYQGSTNPALTVEMGPTARAARAGRPELHVGSPAVATEWLRENIGIGHLAGLFSRDGALVYTPREGAEGYVRLTASDDDADGPYQIHSVVGPQLASMIQYTYFCYKTKERAETDKDGEETVVKERVATMFPTSAARVPVDMPHMVPNLRRLRGIVHSPLVRKDGSILHLPGYDVATKLLHLPEPGLVVPVVPERPSSAEIAAAVALCEEMVAGFAFLSQDHKANYFGLLLTPLLRELVGPPYKMGAIGAPQPGSGKSLLATIMRTVHGGVFRSEIPEDEAEMHKQISSILDTTTAPVCQFDNVTGVLRSSTLAGLLTSNRWEARRLGSHTQIDRPNDRLWMITGNNLCIGGDLVRRTVSVTIDPGVPDPHLRTGFAIANLEMWAQDHRGELIAALLTMIRAWVAAGRPTKPRGSDGFAGWIEAVDGILANAGVPGTFDSPATVSRTTGSEDDEWGEFLTAVYASFGTYTWTAKQLLERVIAPQEGWSTLTPVPPAVAAGAPGIPIDALPAKLAELVQRSRTGPTAISKTLGMWLANRDGRWAGRITVRSAGKDAHSKVKIWRAEVMA